jgi:hypothetical protein
MAKTPDGNRPNPASFPGRVLGAGRSGEALDNGT